MSDSETAVFIDDLSVPDDPFQLAPSSNNGLRPEDGPQDHPDAQPMSQPGPDDGADD